MAVSNPATLSSVISEAAASGLGTYDSLYDFRRNGPVLGDSETTIGYGTEASPLKLSQFNGFEFVQYFWFSASGGSYKHPIAVDQNGKIHSAYQGGDPPSYYHYTATKNGAFEWGKYISNSSGYSVEDMTFDGSSAIYTTGGYSASSYGWISKRDTSGNRSFLKQVEAVSTDVSNVPVIAASTSNIYIGLDRTNTNTQSAVSLAKYNSSGTLQWFRNVSGEKIGISNICIDSAENQYYVGYDYSGTGRGHMFKVNSSGTLQWQKLLSIVSDLNLNGGCAYNNSEGALYASGGAGYVFKFDTNGNLVWQRKIGAGSWLGALTVGADGYIYASGTGSATENAVVIKMDTSGNLIWQRNFTVNARVGLDSNYSSVSADQIVVSGSNLYLSLQYSIFVPMVGYTSYATIVKLPTDGTRTGGVWNASSYSWTTPSITLSNGSRTLATASPAVNSDISGTDANYTQSITKNSL